MSHLIAYAGNEPENMACALFSARGALYSRGTTRLELIQELCRDGFPVPAPYGGVTA